MDFVCFFVALKLAVFAPVFFLPLEANLTGVQQNICFFMNSVNCVSTVLTIQNLFAIYFTPHKGNNHDLRNVQVNAGEVRFFFIESKTFLLHGHFLNRFWHFVRCLGAASVRGSDRGRGSAIACFCVITVFVPFKF